jgi:rhamnosyltransferase subunit B
MAKGKVVLATFGSYGDLHPFMALALELQQLGLEPVIATTANYRDKIEGEDIAFHPVRPNPEQLLRDIGLPLEQFAEKLARSDLTYFIESSVLPYLAEAYDDCRAVMADADLVVVSTLSIAAMMAAESLGKPTINVALQPLVLMSPDDPPALEQLPFLPMLRRAFGPAAPRLIFALGRWSMRRMNGRVNAIRRALGLASLAPGEGFIDAYRADAVVALYSPLLGGAPARPSAPTTLAGFAFHDRDGPVADPLPDEIEAFLAAGDAPLVFTLGSFFVLSAGRFYEQAVRAARLLGRRAILLVGREAEARVRETLAAPDVLVLGYAPHSTIFPRAGACIHHGGVGTTAQALRAGGPQLVCPIFGDQGDNGYRIRRLGVGAVLPLKRFTAERAAGKLRALLGDGGVRERTKSVAAVVGQENGARVLAGMIAGRVGG